MSYVLCGKFKLNKIEEIEKTANITLTLLSQEDYSSSEAGRPCGLWFCFSSQSERSDEEDV